MDHRNALVVVCLIALSMASSTAPGQTPTTEHLRREIDKIIRFDTEIDYRKTPGFIVGILDGDSTYILPFGVRVPGTDDAITADDRFEIGGLTKVFTHLLLLKLDQRGILALDSVVNHLLPPTCSNPALAGLTIRSLLNHTSGIPKYPPMFGDAQEATQNPYGSFDEAKLLTAYQQLVPRDIGEFRYSHFNYALAEPILHYGLGLDYATLLKRELLAPLNMTRTSLDTVNLAPGYALSGRQVQPWTFSSFASSEGLKSSLGDLLHFLKYCLGPEVERLWQHIEPVSVNKRLSMGPGWYIVRQRRAPPVLAHSGHTDGHYVFAAMVRQTGTGVVVLANSAAGVEDLGFLILRLINRNWKRR